jgi:hypothetical protein
LHNIGIPNVIQYEQHGSILEQPEQLDPSAFDTARGSLDAAKRSDPVALVADEIRRLTKCCPEDAVRKRRLNRWIVARRSCEHCFANTSRSMHCR